MYSGRDSLWSYYCSPIPKYHYVIIFKSCTYWIEDSELEQSIMCCLLQLKHGEMCTFFQVNQWVGCYSRSGARWNGFPRLPGKHSPRSAPSGQGPSLHIDDTSFKGPIGKICPPWAHYQVRPPGGVLTTFFSAHAWNTLTRKLKVEFRIHDLRTRPLGVAAGRVLPRKLGKPISPGTASATTPYPLVDLEECTHFPRVLAAASNT